MGVPRLRRDWPSNARQDRQENWLEARRSVGGGAIVTAHKYNRRLDYDKENLYDLDVETRCRPTTTAAAFRLRRAVAPIIMATYNL
jgi:hypothetical protein